MKIKRLTSAAKAEPLWDRLCGTDKSVPFPESVLLLKSVPFPKSLTQEV